MSLFGNNISSQNQQNSLFGTSNNQNSAGGLFSNNSDFKLGKGTINGSSLFGSGSSSGILFGNNNNNNTNSLFGATNNANTENKSNTGQGLFGANNNNPTNISFGQNNNSNNTGIGGLFGTNNNSINTDSKGLFGTNNNSANSGTGGLFGTNNNTINKGTGGLFGTNNNTSNNDNTNNKGVSFGVNNNTSSSGGGLFGTNNNSSSTGGLFGTNNNSSSTTGGLLDAKNSSNTTGTNLIFGKDQANNNDNANKTNGTSFLSHADNSNKPKESSSSNTGIFGINTTTTKVETTINTSENSSTKNSKINVSLFSGNINTNKNTDSTGAQKETSALFPKSEHNNTIENKTNTNSLFNNLPQTGQNTNKIEEKKEDKTQASNIGNKSSIFGVNNQQNTDSTQNKIIFGVQNQPKEEQNKIQSNNNPPANNNNNIQNNNQPNNNENNEYKLMDKIPEVPFQFSECKELQDNEKNQLLHKTNYEIIEELKNMLTTQKEKYKECTKNTRAFESKCIDMIKINLDNAKISKINERNGNAILENINSINERSKYLKKTIEFIDNKMTGVLKPYKENIINRDNILFNQTNVDKFKFYEDFINVSKKCFSIENDLNETEQILSNKDKELSDKLNDQGNNVGSNGIWIERPNKMKLFINQNEMNSLLSECYDGLMNLKNMQDTFDKKYDLLKQSLIKATRNNNIQ